MKNILYIHTHDTGCFTSAYGKNVPTPHVKAFAEDALSFRHAFCASPTCSPSRGALLTGRYPHENGLIGLAHRGFSIQNPETHMASFFRSQGFETVLCGVQHEEKSYDYTSRSTVYSQTLGYEKNLSFLLEEGCPQDRCQADHINAERTAEYLLHRCSDRPFFLSYGMFQTHRPYPESETFDPESVELPEGVFDTEEARLDTSALYESLAQFDRNFQIVMDSLKAAGLYENTIIISTTDHGLANPFSKCTLFDRGIGVSLIVRIPQYPLTHGTWYNGMVSHVDLFPTLCDAEGLPKPAWLSGVSLLPVFENPQHQIRDYVFAEINFHTSYEPARCVRTQRYKYIRYYDEAWDKYNMTNCDDSALKGFLVQAGWREQSKPRELLFDLYFDPMENNNLVCDSEYEEVLQHLRLALHDWQIRTHDRIPAWQDYKGLCKLNRRDDLSPTVTDPSQLDSAIEAAVTH